MLNADFVPVDGLFRGRVQFVIPALITALFLVILHLLLFYRDWPRTCDYTLHTIEMFKGETC